MGQSALSPANSRVAPFCFLNKTRVYAAPEATASRKGSFPERAKEGVTREDRRVCPGCRAISHAMSRLIREIAAPRKRGFLVASILYIYLSLSFHLPSSFSLPYNFRFQLSSSRYFLSSHNAFALHSFRISLNTLHQFFCFLLSLFIYFLLFIFYIYIPALI